jgi:hypothetical protein
VSLLVCTEEDIVPPMDRIVTWCGGEDVLNYEVDSWTGRLTIRPTQYVTPAGELVGHVFYLEELILIPQSPSSKDLVVDYNGELIGSGAPAMLTGIRFQGVRCGEGRVVVSEITAYPTPHFGLQDTCSDTVMRWLKAMLYPPMDWQPLLQVLPVDTKRPPRVGAATTLFDCV